MTTAQSNSLIKESIHHNMKFHNTKSSAFELKAILTKNDTLNINEDGKLTIEDCIVENLISKFGSPLYIVSESAIRSNYRRIYESFNTYWPTSVNILYALKANNNLAIRAILHQEGAGGDCFGESELYATFKAGANPQNIVLNGSYKKISSLRKAAKLGVTIGIDNEDEIEELNKLSNELDYRIPIMLRLKLLSKEFRTVETDYFGGNDLLEYIRKVKWGFSLKAAERLLRQIIGANNLDLRGYHFHIGRAAQDIQFHKIWATTLGKTVIDLYQRTGFLPCVLDIGGGWPRERDPESRSTTLNPHSIEDYANAVCYNLSKILKDTDMEIPDLWIEPGRYIIGNAVILAATVGAIKHDLGKTWINLDVSTNNLMRIETSGSKYHIFPVKDMRRAITQSATIVGETCVDSILSSECPIPDLELGEPFAILDAGMYAETASTQFNGIPRPATVLVNGSNVDLIKERETVDDVFSKHQIPDRLIST